MRIIIGIDASAASRVACDLVASRSWPASSQVRLVAAIEPPTGWTGLPPAAGQGIAEEEAALAAILDDRADELRTRGLTCEVIVEIGRAGEVLLSHAAEWFADLVVVGSRGLGPTASALLGSVSAHLVDHAPCPVLVARSPRAERMLLATDGSRSCLGIPRLLALWSPAFHGLDVEVLSIARGSRRAPRDGGLDGHRRIAEQVADEMIELGWRAAAVARAGAPEREIVGAAEGFGADLVVTGSRGLGTLQRLLSGSVAHSVLLHTSGSVLVMRGLVMVPRRAPERLLSSARAGP